MEGQTPVLRVAARVALLAATAICLAVASPAAASRIFLQSVPASAVTDPIWEIVNYQSDQAELAGIRFTLDSPLTVTGAAATLFRNPSFPNGRFFAGFEALSSASAFPAFSPADGAAALLGYSEANASTALGSEVLFPMSLELAPGSYALIVGCVAPDCEGDLPFNNGFTEALIPQADFLVSYGPTTAQTWFSGASGAFRLAILTVPEPSSSALLTLGLVALGLLGTRFPRTHD